MKARAIGALEHPDEEVLALIIHAYGDEPQQAYKGDLVVHDPETQAVRSQEKECQAHLVQVPPSLPKTAVKKPRPLVTGLVGSFGFSEASGLA